MSDSDRHEDVLRDVRELVRKGVLPHPSEATEVPSTPVDPWGALREELRLARESRPPSTPELLKEVLMELRATRDGEEPAGEEPDASGPDEPKPAPNRKRKAKRSRKGQRLVWDVRESIFMDALREHHDYEGGEAENFDPMPFCDLANVLAKKTGRSAKSLYPYVTEFLKFHFKNGEQAPYSSYEAACTFKEPLRRVLAKYYGDTKAFGVSRDG